VRPAEPPTPFATDQPLGFIHIDVKYLAAIGRATRFVCLEVLPDRSAAIPAGFLLRVLTAFPLRVHSILTDSGSECADCYAVDKPGKPEGAHGFDRVCAQHGIRHILTRPFRPQTNPRHDPRTNGGSCLKIARFKRRLAERPATHPKSARNCGKNSFTAYQAQCRPHGFR
jgi:hypothetical protein